MPTQDSPDRLTLLQGTLDPRPQHGQGIARAIQNSSDDELLVEHGAGAVGWGASDNNRKARFYTLTKAGRKQLTVETSRWQRLASAICRVLGPEEV